MQYLVFGVLLILGAVMMGLFLYLSHAKNKIEAVVLESFCDIDRDEQEIKSIRVTHVLEFESEGEKKKIETDLFPVRELSGAKLSLYYSRKNEMFYVPDYKKYASLLGAFAFSGVICVMFYFCRLNQVVLLQEFGNLEWLAALLGVIAVVTFSHITMITNPAVVKAKGNFEGILKSEEDTADTEVYSLWYGEHRQYAKRTTGMLIKQRNEEPVTLYFNTRTGQVSRLHEFLISMCTSAVAFSAMVIVLLML